MPYMFFLSQYDCNGCPDASISKTHLIMFSTARVHEHIRETECVMTDVVECVPAYRDTLWSGWWWGGYRFGMVEIRGGGLRRTKTNLAKRPEHVIMIL